MGKKRKVTPPKALNPSEKLVEEACELLIEHYSHRPKFRGDPILKANEVIEQCKKGWYACPRTFQERVRTKLGYNGAGNLRNYGEQNAEKAAIGARLEKMMDEAEDSPYKGQKDINKKTAYENAIDEAGRIAFTKGLDKEEKSFFTDREKIYRKEFKFNSSADFSLLFEVIAAELRVRKIHQMEFEELRKPSPDQNKLLAYSKMINEANMNLDRAQKSLGITREQRKDELDRGAGDISSLSVQFDKKKKLIKAREEAMKEEELSGLDRKWRRGDVFHVDGLSRPVHNRIPQLKDIDQILKEAGYDEDNLVYLDEQ